MIRPGSADVSHRIVLPLLAMAIITAVAIVATVAYTSQRAGGDIKRQEAKLVSRAFHTSAALRAAIILRDEGGALRFDRAGNSLEAEPPPPDLAAFAVRAATTNASGDKSEPYYELDWQGGQPRIKVAVQTRTGEINVGALPLRGKVLDVFAREMGLREAVVVRSGVRFRLSHPTTPLIDSAGASNAILSWTSDLELTRLVIPAVAPGVGLIALVISAGVWFHRQTRRLAQSLVASEEHAQHLALHDPLTGLANRALFSSRLDLAIEQRRRAGGIVAVLLVDLDRFKQVNDSLGHAAGDELIREASRRLLSICRTTDTVARLGGDELALVALLPSLGAVDVLARRTVETLSGAVELPGGEARLSASVGVTVIDGDVMDGPESLRRADLALYRAKDQGRGRYAMFEQEMDESLRRRRATEDDLRAAIAAGDLTVHYQPQFTARDSKLESVEALVRWRNADGQMVSPAYFIPIAEESGLIHSLGEFVMRQACLDAGRWPGLTVAVNVSPVQLRNPTFVDLCLRILHETGTEAGRIELEITEGVLLDNDHRTQETLHALRDAGFKLALDDFGTGYSSLSYLNAYPVDKIKIDQSFVSALGVQEDAGKVVKAIVRLGRALGLQVTAEGVETEAQRTELVSAGCTLLQGYLEARPTPAEGIDELIAKGGKQAA